MGNQLLDYFSRSALADPTTDELRLAIGFGENLERLRVKLDASIYLSSACRSPTHNAKVGSHPRGLHLIVNGHRGTGGTCAIDAVATEGEYRAKIVMQALDRDWSVGVASNFIHVDQRPARIASRGSRYWASRVSVALHNDSIRGETTF